MSISSNAPPGQSRLARIQGNVYPGFRKDFQAFVAVSFSSTQSAQRWLQSVTSEVASGEEVEAFNLAFRSITARVPDEEARVITARWCNVALTWHGLQCLGAPDVERLPAALKTNRIPFVERS